MKIINESVKFTVNNRYSYNGLKGYEVECNDSSYFDKLSNVRDMSKYLNLNVEMSGFKSACIVETDMPKDRLQNLLNRYSETLS